MKCKNCGCKITTGVRSSAYLHDYFSVATRNCPCGCANPEPMIMEELKCQM